MGCDIHLHTEVKIDGKWHHYGAPNVPRSYRLFGLMAGVRNDEVEPIAAPRGLPDDISEVTALSAKRWGSGAHSHSWLSSEELAILDERWYALGMGRTLESDLEHHYFGYLEGNSWAGFSRYPDERPKGIEDVRFVFWFDN